MQAFENRRLLAVKVLLESFDKNEVDKAKMLTFINELIVTCPGNAYLLLESKEQKNRHEELYKKLDSVVAKVEENPGMYDSYMEY